MLICGLALFVLNILLFLPAMKGDFIFDDIHLVRDSPITQSPSFLRDFLWQAFGDPLGKDANSREFEKDVQFYRPLTSFSYWLDFKLWGLNAAGFHLTNTLVHAFNVILLFLLVLRIFGDLRSAFASALLFSLFPTHFESVAWISGRTDLLALLFLLVSAHFFLSFLKKGASRQALSSAFFFFLALLSKETVILCFFIFACLFWYFGRRCGRREWLGFVLGFAAVFLLYFSLRGQAVGFPPMTYSLLSVGTLFTGLGFYLARMVFPFFLGFSVPDEKILHSTLFLFLGIGFCLWLIGAGVYFLGKKKSVPFYSLWLLLSFLLLLPSLFILFFANPMSLLAWRFLYLPLAAAVPLLAVCLSRVLRPAFFVLLVAALALLYGMELLPHVRHFGQSDREFWLRLPHLQRENRFYRFNHAVALLPLDEKKAAALLQPLIDDRTSFLADFFQRRALEAGAFFYSAAGDLDKARYYFATLFSRFREQPLNVYFQYANFLARSGAAEKGKKIVDGYVRIFPENHIVLLHAADFYRLLGERAQVLALLERDFRLFPTAAVLKEIQDLQARARPK